MRAVLGVSIQSLTFWAMPTRQFKATEKLTCVDGGCLLQDPQSWNIWLDFFFPAAHLAQFPVPPKLTCIGCYLLAIVHMLSLATGHINSLTGGSLCHLIFFISFFKFKFLITSTAFLCLLNFCLYIYVLGTIDKALLGLSHLLICWERNLDAEPTLCFYYYFN